MAVSADNVFSVSMWYTEVTDHKFSWQPIIFGTATGYFNDFVDQKLMHQIKINVIFLA